jgi:nucleotide-binding universal stress UspA family protein
MTAKVPYVIVVGIDFSDASRLTLREGLKTGLQRGGGEVHVVHVDSNIAEGTPHRPSAAPSALDPMQQLHVLVVEEVAAFRTILRPFVGATMRVVLHVRTNAPGKEIAQLAADLEADLVVVGTHGRTGLTRVLLGSVAHEVVSLSPCPVLVVRAKNTSYVPDIEPPCPRCVEARKESGGRELWCDQHRAHHGRRHTYYQDDRVGQETNFPLVFDET